MRHISLKEIRNFKYRVNPEERQGSYGLYFMRKISLVVTWLLVNLGLSANQVTLLQIVAGVAGCFFLAFSEIKFLVLGVLLLQLGFLFDNVDGEIARLRKQVSITGKFLDTVGHEIVVPFFYFALAVGSYQRTGNFEVIIFGFLAGLFSLRLDIATLYLEAGQMAESRLDDRFEYYADFQKEAPDQPAPGAKLYRQKNEPTPVRVLYALFAYPGTMNVFALAILTQIFFQEFEILHRRVEPIYLLLVIYGTLIPIRRIYTIWKLVAHREADRKYLHLIK